MRYRKNIKASIRMCWVSMANKEAEKWRRTSRRPKESIFPVKSVRVCHQLPLVFSISSPIVSRGRVFHQSWNLAATNHQWSQTATTLKTYRPLEGLWIVTIGKSRHLWVLVKADIRQYRIITQMEAITMTIHLTVTHSQCRRLIDSKEKKMMISLSTMITSLREKVVELRIHSKITGKNRARCIQRSSHSTRKTFLTSISKETIFNCSHRSKTTWQIYLERASNSTRISRRQRPSVIPVILHPMINVNRGVSLP